MPRGDPRGQRAYEADGLRERMGRHHRDPDAAFYGWNDVWLHPEFPHWDITDVLPDITGLLLLIQGEHDQYGTMAQLDPSRHVSPVPVERVHPSARHAPHLEAPRRRWPSIAGFVRRLADRVDDSLPSPMNDQLRRRSVGPPAARSMLLTMLGEYVLPCQRMVSGRRR